MEMKHYNKIPNDWIVLDTVKFSKLLKTFLVKRAYYSIQELFDDEIFI